MWPNRRLLVVILSCFLVVACHGWEWSDYTSGGGKLFGMSSSDTLSLQEVSEMRVRDLKRRLSRQHGYSADELGRILDKKELIEILAYEEYKVHQAHVAELERTLIKRGILVAVVAVLVVLCWPLLSHLYEVAHVNLVVYTDRKRHEASKCWEFRSVKGCAGVLFMGFLDLLGIWLTVSVLLSWVMSTDSPYFFPIPSLTVRPAQFMGGQVASGPLSRYGINTGPMLVTWTIRFVHGYVEQWVGRALSKCRQDAKKAKRKKKKYSVDAEAKRAAKAERRAARQAAKRQQGQSSNQGTGTFTTVQGDATNHDAQREQNGEEAFSESKRDGTEFPKQQEEPTITAEPEPSMDEKRKAAAAAAEIRWKTQTAFDELD